MPYQPNYMTVAESKAARYAGFKRINAYVICLVGFIENHNQGTWSRKFVPAWAREADLTAAFDMAERKGLIFDAGYELTVKGEAVCERIKRAGFDLDWHMKADEDL